MKIRTEIITRTDRIILMSRRESPTAWCPVCSEMARLITPEQAAIITQTGARSIYRLIETAYAEQTERAPVLPAAAAASQGDPDGAYAWVETGRLHFFESTEGLLYVCLNSLQ